MTDIAIRVDNLSKLYHLGAVHQRPDTLRDALTGFLPRTLAPALSAGVTRISRNQKTNSQNSPNTCTCVRRKCSRQVSPVNSQNSRQASASPDDLWALKDVSFYA